MNLATHINYYCVCYRKRWFFANNIQKEQILRINSVFKKQLIELLY